MKTNWIKTEDKLPPIGEKVLCWWGDGPEILMLADRDYFASGCMRVGIEQVSCWQPINPPRAGK